MRLETQVTFTFDLNIQTQYILIYTKNMNITKL